MQVPPWVDAVTARIGELDYGLHVVGLPGIRLGESAERDPSIDQPPQPGLVARANTRAASS